MIYFFFTHFTSIISTFFPFLDCSVDRPLPPRQIDQHLAMAASANSLYALYPENNVADLSFLDYELIHLATDCHDAAAMYNRSAVGWQTLTKVDRQKQRQNVFSGYMVDTYYETLTTMGEAEDCFPYVYVGFRAAAFRTIIVSIIHQVNTSIIFQVAPGNQLCAAGEKRVNPAKLFHEQIAYFHNK